jgi:mannosyltransferase
MSDAAVVAATPGLDATPGGGAGPASSGVRLAVVACTGVALALGLFDLQRRSFWQDEAFTWSTVDRSFPALLSVMMRHEGYQILHAVIEWPTNRISSTVTGLRMPSVLAFAAAVPAVWLTGRRLFDERTGVIAAFLFAINGSVLSYAQEARSYMLATMLAAYAGALLAQYVMAPRRWTRGAWITFSVLTIYAHGFAVLAIVAQILALWFLPESRRRELHWIRDGVLIAALAAPAILAPIFQINSGETSFITRPGVHAIGVFVWFIAGRTATAIPAYGVGVVVATVAATAVWRRQLHSVDAFRYALLLLWAVLPAFVVMATSIVRPIWIDRYALWSAGALVVLVAHGLTRVAHGRALGVVVLVTALLSVRGVVDWYRAPPYEDYRSAMGQLSVRLQPRDALIFSPDEVRIPAEFYLRRDTRRLDLIPLFPEQPWGQFKTGQQRVVPFTERTISLADPNRYPRIWLVAFDVRTTLKSQMADLNHRYRVTSDHEYQGGVEVLLLQARTSAAS